MKAIGVAAILVCFLAMVYFVFDYYQRGQIGQTRGTTADTR
ncbi:hypothetical protein [Bradyrhizobium sp. OAE829]